jgi:hypothetical protein
VVLVARRTQVTHFLVLFGRRMGRPQCDPASSQVEVFIGNTKTGGAHEQNSRGLGLDRLVVPCLVPRSLPVWLSDLVSFRIRNCSCPRDGCRGAY